MNPNTCPTCGGKRFAKTVDKANAYKFTDVPCGDCKGTGYVQESPASEGMYLCSKCGKRKYDYKHIGLRCVVCEIDAIMEAHHRKWKPNANPK